MTAAAVSLLFDGCDIPCGHYLGTAAMYDVIYDAAAIELRHDILRRVAWLDSHRRAVHAAILEDMHGSRR